MFSAEGGSYISASAVSHRGIGFGESHTAIFSFELSLQQQQVQSQISNLTIKTAAMEITAINNMIFDIEKN